MNSLSNAFDFTGNGAVRRSRAYWVLSSVVLIAGFWPTITYRTFFWNPPTSVLSSGSNHVCSLASPTSERAFLIIGTQWAANLPSEPLTKPTCIPRLFRVEAPKNVFHPALLNASPMSFTRSWQSSEPVIHHPNIICWGSLPSSDPNLSFCFPVRRLV
jgi:hypothetical protein